VQEPDPEVVSQPLVKFVVPDPEPAPNRAKSAARPLVEPLYAGHVTFVHEHRKGRAFWGPGELCLYTNGMYVEGIASHQMLGFARRVVLWGWFLARVAAVLFGAYVGASLLFEQALGWEISLGLGVFAALVGWLAVGWVFTLSTRLLGSRTTHFITYDALEEIAFDGKEIWIAYSGPDDRMIGRARVRRRQRKKARAALQQLRPLLPNVG